MANNMERHLFPGANTPLGFYSLFHNILPEENARNYYYIKGGPGSGKSTFMRQIAKEMADRNERVEYFHCASDPDSLDAVFFPELATVLIDATAPHHYDPKYPGVSGHLIDMGAFWESQKIKTYRDRIQKAAEAKKNAFSTAFHYLACAQTHLMKAKAQVQQKLPLHAIDQELFAFLEEHIENAAVKERRGTLRQLFATGFTPAGHLNYLDSILEGCSLIYRVIGPPGCAVTFVEKLTEMILRHGLDLEGFPCPMDPKGPNEHLYIPALGIAVITGNRYHDLSGSNCRTINMGNYLSHVPDADLMEVSMQQTHFFIEKALDVLKQSKEYHEELEGYYIPYMDFEAIAKRKEQIIAEILA